MLAVKSPNLFIVSATEVTMEKYCWPNIEVVWPSLAYCNLMDEEYSIYPSYAITIGGLHALSWGR